MTDVMKKLLQGRIEAAKRAGADVSNAEEFLETSYTSFDITIGEERNKYRNYLYNLEEVEKAYASKVEETIASIKTLNETANKVRKGYHDTHIEQAEEAFEKGDYDHSIELLQESWRDAEKTIHGSLSSKYGVAQAYLKHNPSEKGEELLEQAKENIESNDYEAAITNLDAIIKPQQQ